MIRGTRAHRNRSRGAAAALRLALALALALAACSGETPEQPSLSPRDPPTNDRAETTSDGIPRLAAWRRFAVDRVLDYRVWRGARAGYVALVAHEDRAVHARVTGMADIERGEEMRLDTRFQLASMTKPITAVAALILVDEGRLALDDPVARYLPRFGTLEVVAERTADGGFTTRPLERPLLVRHLLTFTSGLGGYAETDDPLDQLWRRHDVERPGAGPLAERIDAIADLPLYEPPGERWRYGWSADVLARVVEVAAGVPYDRFLNDRLFGPLGMTGTSYPDDVPADAPVARLVTHDAEGRLVPERRFDDWYGRGWTPGGGGLVSTATDYARFALMLARGGELGGVRILRAETVAAMLRLHVAEGVLAEYGIEGLGWGLGLSVVADADATPMLDANGDAWWSGRFGTHFWIRPATRSAIVVMQQTEASPTTDLPVAGAIVQALGLP